MSLFNKKVKFFDKNLTLKFKTFLSTISLILSLILIFITIPDKCKIQIGFIFILILSLIYIYFWLMANSSKSINIKINKSTVVIKEGDLFKENGLKVITFNEYFDTNVNDKIISKNSINGIFLNTYLKESIDIFDSFIKNNIHKKNEVESKKNREKDGGKNLKYKIGTTLVYENEYILTAFTMFDDDNMAYLTMPNYINFLISFWDEINIVYAKKDVVVPILGSGITRIKGHKEISNEELLNIMLWTFKISEMRFKHPAKLIIVIHKSIMNQINLLNIKTFQD